MKKILLITGLVVAYSFTFLPGVYDYAITTADDIEHPMSAYQGQKMLIVILSATQTADDSAYLQRLDSISIAYQSQLKIIAVPSYEDGFTDDTVAALLPWYQSQLDAGIVLTQGMRTHKSSGTEQHPLFGWLTNAGQNGHFEEEVGGPGQMYFINEQGDLYGVFGPSAKWSNKVLNRMLQ